MDWAFWGTVSFTIVACVVSLYILTSQKYAYDETFIAIRSSWWFAWAVVFGFPSGLFVIFSGAVEGANSPFAVTLPDVRMYWTQLLPSSYRFEMREQFQDYYPTSMIVLTVIAFLSLTMGMYRLIWQPINELRGYSRNILKMLFSKHEFLFFMKAFFLALVVTTIYIVALQTIFFLIGHAVATFFYVLPILGILLVIGILGAAVDNGTDVYDRNGRRIGRVDRW